MKYTVKMSRVLITTTLIYKIYQGSKSIIYIYVGMYREHNQIDLINPMEYVLC